MALLSDLREFVENNPVKAGLLAIWLITAINLQFYLFKEQFQKFLSSGAAHNHYTAEQVLKEAVDVWNSTGQAGPDTIVGSVQGINYEIVLDRGLNGSGKSGPRFVTFTVRFGGGQDEIKITDFVAERLPWTDSSAKGGLRFLNDGIDFVSTSTPNVTVESSFNMLDEEGKRLVGHCYGEAMDIAYRKLRGTKQRLRIALPLEERPNKSLPLMQAGAGNGKPNVPFSAFGTQRQTIQLGKSLLPPSHGSTTFSVHEKRHSGKSI